MMDYSKMDYEGMLKLRAMKRAQLKKLISKDWRSHADELKINSLYGQVRRMDAVVLACELQMKLEI